MYEHWIFYLFSDVQSILKKLGGLPDVQWYILSYLSFLYRLRLPTMTQYNNAFSTCKNSFYFSKRLFIPADQNPGRCQLKCFSLIPLSVCLTLEKCPGDLHTRGTNHSRGRDLRTTAGSRFRFINSVRVYRRRILASVSVCARWVLERLIVWISHGENEVARTH